MCLDDLGVVHFDAAARLDLDRLALQRLGAVKLDYVGRFYVARDHVILEHGRQLFLGSEKIPAFRGMNVLTPTIIGDSIFTSAYGGKSLLLQIAREGDSLRPSVLWENKTQGYMSSPVVIEGHAYLHLRNQRFACVNLKTGQETWTTKPYGKYWSLVAQRDRILALDERGELLLIRANPEKFDLLDTRKISEQPTWAHLAVCGEAVFVRELNAISAYRWK